MFSVSQHRKVARSTVRGTNGASRNIFSMEELNTNRPMLIFWVPRNLSNHMDRQANTRVKSKEMAGRSQTLPAWLGEGEVKTTESKYIGSVDLLEGALVGSDGKQYTIRGWLGVLYSKLGRFYPQGADPLPLPLRKAMYLLS